jgi:hypothetical protein
MAEPGTRWNPLQWNPTRPVRLIAAGVASAGIIVLAWFDIIQLLLMPLLLFALWIPLLLPPVKLTPTQKMMRFLLIAMLTALLVAGGVALFLQLRRGA